MQGSTFVGLDVHKRCINVAVLLAGSDTPVEWRISNEPSAIRRMLKRIACHISCKGRGSPWRRGPCQLHPLVGPLGSCLATPTGAGLKAP
jgi:hypothetical protein